MLYAIAMGQIITCNYFACKKRILAHCLQWYFCRRSLLCWIFMHICFYWHRYYAILLLLLYGCWLTSSNSL